MVNHVNHATPSTMPCIYSMQIHPIKQDLTTFAVENPHQFSRWPKYPLSLGQLQFNGLKTARNIIEIKQQG